MDAGVHHIQAFFVDSFVEKDADVGVLACIRLFLEEFRTKKYSKSQCSAQNSGETRRRKFHQKKVLIFSLSICFF